MKWILCLIYPCVKLRVRNDKLERMLLESQEKLSVFVAANQGNEIQATKVHNEFYIKSKAIIRLKDT